jgi:hypothetical protein
LHGERSEQDGREVLFGTDLLEKPNERLAGFPDWVGGESVLESDGSDVV